MTLCRTYVSINVPSYAPAMSSRPARARRAAASTRREAARAIVAAAERLLRDRPYRELSVEEVMAEAGLSRTIFYRHFDGLPELVLSLFDAITQALMAELQAAPGPGATRGSSKRRSTPTPSTAACCAPSTRRPATTPGSRPPTAPSSTHSPA